MIFTGIIEIKLLLKINRSSTGETLKILHLKLSNRLYDDLVIVSEHEGISKQRICKMVIEGPISRLKKSYSATEKDAESKH